MGSLRLRPSVYYNPTSMLRVVRGVLSTLALLAVGCATITPPDGATLARLEPLLGQLLLVGFDGTDGVDNAELEQLVCASRVGGVLLFSRNVTDAAQVRHLTGWIRARAAACHAPSPLVAMDAEGGHVMRLSP